MMRVVLAFALLALPALAHDGTHDRWLESLQQPDGASCCSGKDCLATDDWRMTAAGYEVWWNGRWQLVPANRVITHRGNPVGSAVLCAGGENIFCFVPGGAT